MDRAVRRVDTGVIYCDDNLDRLSQLPDDSVDLIYLDPPYDPVSPTASFASYTAGGFGWEDQKRLAHACVVLNRRGVRFLLSNSATERIRALYSGFEQRLVRAPRFINSKAGGRGHVDELLVFNA